MDTTAVWTAVARFCRSAISYVVWGLSQVFGNVHWQAPEWLRWTGRQQVRAWRFLRADWRRLAALALAVTAAAAGLWWYKTRPQPHYVEYTVMAPVLTTYDENGKPEIHPLRVQFAESAAPLKSIEKEVSAGVGVAPAIAGTWFWTSDRQLQFMPKDDWPVGAGFKVRFDKAGFLAPGVFLEDYRFAFDTAPFAATIQQSEFYQDPRDPNMKKLVATVAFSHPVDTGAFEERVSLVFASDAEYLGVKPDPRGFTIVYDELKLAAHVHSTPLGMPRDDTPMTLRVDRGVHASRGGNETGERLESVVNIPGRSSLKFSSARMTIVDNARYEPEQIFLISSSSPVAEKAFTGKINAYVLPARHPDQSKEDKEPHAWRAEEVGRNIVARSDPLTLTYVPSDEGGNTAHGFRFTAPVGRYVYVVARDGIEGIGGYFSGKPYAETFVVQPFPKALTFLGQGALLPLSGDKRIGFLARDVGKVEVEIGRVLPDQLQHLAPQMWDFSRPNRAEPLESKIVERLTIRRDFSGRPAGKPSYDTVDLGNYLQDKAQTRRGLFLLRIAEVPQDSSADQPEYGEEGYPYYDQPGAGDERLILVTDLGVISKQSKDGSRDVFVQSLRTGLPVAGARIEILGRNGLPVQSSVTDATGRAQLPKLPDLRREKTPLMILAEKDDDFSFMPFKTGGRELDLSRFDTGGVENAESSGQLSSYVFSDRGIYRPGETTHLGIVTRAADWSTSLAGLPLEIQIVDPRGALVSSQQVKLSSMAFDEISYTTSTASPTGLYQVSAFLVKDPKKRELLGSSSFKVQEFEPDRMKVALSLAERPSDAWLTTAEVKARLEVIHLFGEPAANRRVESEMSITPVLPQFSKYSDYRFQIGEVVKEPYRETLASVNTDDKGVAELQLNLGRFAGRAYRLNVLARAFEAEGGRNVAAQTAAIVSDAPYLVGVKPDGPLNFVRRETARAARWIAVDRQLNPVAAEGLTLEWVQQKFVSVLTEQPNRTYQYVSRLKEIVRSTRPARIAAGGSDLPLPTGEPGDFILVLRNAQGVELNRLAYNVAGQANLSRSLDRNAELQVELDKPVYSGGDTIEVSIRAPYVGAGLIAIERERVYQYQWFKTSTTSVVQRITLPRDFEGNGYVSVQFLRDPSSEELFLSPLSYGVAPFSVNLSERTTRITLTAAREVKPGALLAIHVAPSEPSRVAVLAVDEGILQVARYKNPDPLGYFFQKRMLEVRTTQILDLLLPEFKRFLALAAPGGDADGGFARHLNPFNRKRKPPVAFWSGLIDAGPQGRELRYTVPDYFNGNLRIVAIAVNARRVGVASTATEVKGDFILTPNVPALVAPGDEFIVSVGVFNNTIGGNGPVEVQAQPAGGLALAGPGSVSLEIADKKEGVAEFRFKASPNLGAATMNFVARRTSGAQRLESAIEESVSVRPPAPYRTLLKLGRFEGARNVVPLTREMYSEFRKVNASVSTLPLVWGQGLTAMLDSYPYSCTEQLVSQSFSGMLVISRSEFGTAKSREPAADALARLFSTLQSRQNSEGGLGLWSSSPVTAEFPTVYAAHLLIETRDHGQRIPEGMLSPLNTWLTRLASSPASSLEAARLRAYAVYLLTRQGIRAPSALSNVEQELSQRYPDTWRTDLAAAYLAATYRLMQRNNDAARIIQDVPWSQKKTGWNDEEFYYGDVVHDAQLLYLVAKHFPDRMTTPPTAALEGIARSLSDGGVNSLSASYTLLALDAYARTSSTSVRLGIVEERKDGGEFPLNLSAGSMPKAAVPETAAKVDFTKEGPLAAYYSLDESGFDRNLPAAEISEGVEIIHELLDLTGSPISEVKVGQEFLIRLRVRATTRDRIQQIAIVDLLPGGVEPVLETQPTADSSQGFDPALTGAGRAAPLPVGLPDRSTWRPDHIDVRDDRLVLYGNVARSADTFVYRVRATNAGTFRIPPAFAEGMYNRRVAGQGLAGKLDIVKP
ncbi:MAG TPA: alpha-2-macroglobulin [Terriglobia bacterium]|nr:alpha-2-macroglobulin [Terriglobia bacterium]